MAQRLDEGVDAAFTIDGRAGRVTSPSRSGNAGAAVGPANHLISHWSGTRVDASETWDLFQIPKPFTRAVLFIAPAARSAEDTDRDGLELKHQEMQKILERLRDVAEGWFSLSPAEQDRERANWNREAA